MLLSSTLFGATLAARALVRNRYVRSRLGASAGACALAAALSASVHSALVTPAFGAPVDAVRPLLLVFGALNAIVALVINPWRTDRLPDRFPTIVQDAIVIGACGLVATLVLQDRIFAASAAGAVVVGLALKDTLGNLFSGLAIQVEKPFRVGHWVRIADIDGRVSEITWRATKVRTRSGDFVVVPNSKLADDIIVNYSEPTPQTRVEVEVGVSYDTPPNRAKETIRRALTGDPEIPTLREPEILVHAFGDSAVVYQVRVWTEEFEGDDRLRDRMRTAIYYALRRARIEIPYPMQVQLTRPEPAVVAGVGTDAATILRGVSVFSALLDAEHDALAAASSMAAFGDGELVVRQGDAGTSMFVVVRGAVIVTVDPDGREVARIGPGGFFGEMSLLTGAPRNATVKAVVDTDLVEITLAAFKAFVLANPGAVEAIGTAVAQRRAELDERRATGVLSMATETRQTLVSRIRRFLGLEATETVAAARPR
mgnify:CR=1 FL=1